MMRYPIIVRNSLVPKLASVFIVVYAITLFPFVFIKDDGDEETINHESIHFRQQVELLIIFFYLIYVFDWIYGLIKYRDKELAYRRIRFEQEAYAKESKKYYLICRKRNAWRKYKI